MFDELVTTAVLRSLSARRVVWMTVRSNWQNANPKGKTPKSHDNANPKGKTQTQKEKRQNPTTMQTQKAKRKHNKTIRQFNWQTLI